MIDPLYCLTGSRQTRRKFYLRTISIVLFCFSSHSGIAQSMFLPQNNKHLPFLERLEIMLQKNPDLNIASPKTITRHLAVDIAGLEDSSSGSPRLKFSRVDQQNLQSLLTNSAEYVTREVPKLGFLSTFYNNPANMFEVNKPRFFMALNPVIRAQQTLEENNDNQIFHYAAGLSFRMLINNNLGFYAYGTNNIEGPPSFVRKRYNEFNAVPGAATFDVTKNNNYQYYDIRGGVTFKALKYFDFQIAYDRNFIGNGYRSLFLSDFGSNYLFGKVNTRVWRFKYQHIYAPMVPQYGNRDSPKRPFGRKVMALHHLSINATNWLNLALFQAVTISSRNDWQYMVPILYYPVSQLTNNKPDNDIAGFEFKANVARRAQFYGQFLLDNFKLKEIREGKGWWNNRFGVQLGLKYIDVLGIDNMDLQLEMNSVRPYTYTTTDTVGNYSHFNQPLAHPFGANFSENIAILRYQPFKKISTSLKAIFWTQGLDSAHYNFGSNILKASQTRPADFGFTIPTGVAADGMNLSFLFSYEMSENVFLDAAVLLRRMKFERNIIAPQNTSMVSASLRINIAHRSYDY